MDISHSLLSVISNKHIPFDPHDSKTPKKMKASNFLSILVGLYRLRFFEWLLYTRICGFPDSVVNPIKNNPIDQP